VSTIPVRDASGYLYLGMINTTSSDNGTTAITRIYASNDAVHPVLHAANFETVMKATIAGDFVQKAGDTMTGETVGSRHQASRHRRQHRRSLDVGDATVITPAVRDGRPRGNANMVAVRPGLHFDQLPRFGTSVQHAEPRGAQIFYLGQSVGWGVASLTIGGNETVSGGNLYLVDGNTTLARGSGKRAPVQTGTGYIDIGSQNASWAHIQSDRASFLLQPKNHSGPATSSLTRPTQEHSAARPLYWSNALPYHADRFIHGLGLET